MVQASCASWKTMSNDSLAKSANEGDRGGKGANSDAATDGEEEEEDQGARQAGQPNGRVGGILECGLPVSNSLGQRRVTNPITGSLCRYGARVVRSGMTFVEIFQIRLQNIFPHFSASPRYHIHDESVELTAECLASDVIRYLLKEDIYLISRDPISRSMRHNVYQMLNKHSILFTSMVNRLNVVPDTAYEAFTRVADELFLHGNVTWARIVCLYAFMGRLALWARDRRMHNLKKKLPLYVSRYVAERIAHFIKGYGGWEQLCVEYPVAEEVTGAVWRSLLFTGATLGLVATILSVTS